MALKLIFNPIEGKLQFVQAAGGADTNITTGTVAAATGARTIDFDSNDLTLDNVNDFTLNSEGEVEIYGHNDTNHYIKSITSGTQKSWFLRARDGGEGVTMQLIADATVPANSQIELGTGSTGAPIFFDTDGYVQVDGQGAQSGEFRVEALAGGHYMATKVDTTAGGAASYTLTYPNAAGTTNQFLGLQSDGTYQWVTPTSSIIRESLSNGTGSATTGTNKAVFRMPFAAFLEDVRISVLTAPTGSSLIVDVNKNGSTILSTKLSIDAGEQTSTTASSPVVISDTSLADDDEISIDIDQVGSTVAGTVLRFVMIFRAT